MRADKSRVEIPAPEILRLAKRFQKRCIALRTGGARAPQRSREPIQRLKAGRPMRNDLGDHGIIERRDGIALAHACIDADSLAFRQGQREKLAAGWQKSLRRIFCVKPRLHRMPARNDVRLSQRQPLAVRHAKLPLHKVNSSDRLGDGMLDLQPRIHFHEIESAGQRAAALGDELHRARADIANRLCRSGSGLPHRCAHGDGDARRRRLFNHLLVTALQRAIALKQMHGAAMRIAENLHFNMARRRNVFFDENAVIAEKRQRLAPRALKRLSEIAGRLHAAHALAPAARHRLYQHGIADGLRGALQRGGVLRIARIARRNRHARARHQRLGFVLEAHRADR